MAANGAATADQVMAYLRENSPEIAALMEKMDKNLVVADVHQQTALGNDGKSKKLSVLDAAKAKMKAADEEKDVEKVEWKADIKVTKTVPDQMLIFGWASVTEVNGEAVVDKQDDVIATEDIEKAAYDFVLYSRMHGDMHFRKGTGRMIESMVFTAEKAQKGLVALDPETGDQLFGWFTGWKIDEPEMWARVKRGELPELSIGGKGNRVTV